MQGALIYRWCGSVPGREAASIALMNETTEVLDHMQANQRIADYAWYVTGQGGPSYLVVRGEAEVLMAFTADRTIQALTTRAGLVNQDFAWAIYATGEAAFEKARFYLELAKAL